MIYLLRTIVEAIFDIIYMGCLNLLIKRYPSQEKVLRIGFFHPYWYDFSFSSSPSSPFLLYTGTKCLHPSSHVLTCPLDTATLVVVESESCGVQSRPLS